METVATKLGKSVGILKSASVLTGVLYAIVFIVMIPFYMNQGMTFDNVFLLTGALVLTALIVHVLLNGLYYLIIALPLLFSAIFFGLGWFIWLNVPLIVGPVEMILELIPYIDAEMGWMMEYFTRVGQSMMAFGGALWWLVKKSKDINQAALYVYLLILALAGIGCGLISPSLTVLFLIFWMTISYKIHEHPTVDTNEQLSVLFKVVATLSLLIATLRNYASASNTWYGETSIGIAAYSILIFLVVSFGIWNPKRIINSVPASIKPIGVKIGELVKSSIFIKGV